MKHSLKATSCRCIHWRATVQKAQVVDDSIWMSPGLASADSFSPSRAWLWPAHHCDAALTASTSSTRPKMERWFVRIASRQMAAVITISTFHCGLASSAIDVSDGLLGDLGHVLRRSAVGARLDVDALPRSAQLAALPPAVQRKCLLHGGDDYELLFTAAAARHEAVLDAAREAGVPVRCIGRIEPGDELVVTDGRGQALAVEHGGFDHFKT